ncbi:Long-chain-fatty-acid--CoA ligase [Entamoeba marina]
MSSQQEVDHSDHTVYIYPDEYEFNGNELMDHDHPLIKSPIEALEHYTLDDPDYPFLGERSYLPNGERGEYEWLSYGEVLETAKNFAKGLLDLGLKKGDVVGFFSKRRLEWHYLFIACGYTGIRLVTLYESLSVDALKHIDKNAEFKHIFVSDDKLKVITQATQVPLSIIEEIHPSDEPSIAKEIGFVPQQPSLYELIEKGKTLNTELKRTDPSDVALIMYTSGTTGNPKGVALTYRNLSASSSSLWMRIPLYLIQDYPRQCRQLRSLSFLPLGHVFAIVMECVMYRVGGSIGFMSSTHLKVIEDISVLKPVVFAAVPRVLQLIYGGVNNIVATKPKSVQLALKAAIKIKEQILFKDPTAIIPSFDKIFFDQFREKFGGRLRIIICAGAPLSLDIARFFRTVICDGFFIGYGMTETTGMGLSTVFKDGLDLDHVGQPFVSSMVKIKCVPEMGYCTHNEQPSGEVFIKTTGQFTGYYKEDIKCIDEEGFVTTNDIVSIRKDNKVRIIARKNNVFKLSQGEYISAEKIESMMTQCKYVQDIFVYGNSLKNYLIAVVVPNFQSIQQWSESMNKTIPKDKKEICCSDEVKKEMIREMAEVANQTGLKGFEKIKKLVLHEHVFDTARDFITPSLKLKRKVLYEFFEKEIEELLKD